MATKLLDYSFARPDPARIKAAGFQGVLRYLAPVSNAGKYLTAGERDALRAQGLAIGLVWEWYAKRAAEGRQAGVQDATAALNQANSLGIPSSVPIFFAIDWDVADYASGKPNTPENGRAKLGPIADYFDGVRSVVGDRAGAYGGYWAIKRLFDANLIKWGWQTYAWSGGQWDKRAQLRQTLNGQWDGQVDFDEAEDGLVGLWTTNHPVASPQPPVEPAPSGDTHKYTIKKNDTFWALEAANGWTHGTLQHLNPGVDPRALKIGQAINVPGGAAKPAPGPSNKYVIRKGDTFWGLENANGWRHGTLQGLNPGVNPTQLQIGQQINIPGGVKAPAQHTYGKYTIASGDTFWALEGAHGWPHGVLEQLNPGVDPRRLGIGKVINTP